MEKTKKDKTIGAISLIIGATSLLLLFFKLKPKKKDEKVPISQVAEEYGYSIETVKEIIRSGHWHSFEENGVTYIWRSELDKDNAPSHNGH